MAVPTHESNVARKLSETCRTFDLGLDGFTECLKVGPNSCRYALPFGYSFLCSHPELGSRRKPDLQPARSPKLA